MAPVTPRPKLRADIVVRKIPSPEETYVILKDPAAQKYFKYEEWEYDLLTLLDGTREIEEVASEFKRRHPAIDADLQAVVDYVEGLRQTGLLERTPQEQHLAMYDQMRTFRKKRFYDAEKSTLFQILIPLFDPDQLMNRAIRWIRWFWSPWFVAPWIAVFAIVLTFLLSHADVYWSSFWSLLDVRRNTFYDWALLLVMLFLTGMWHELGHGFTCKRYGGEVHSIGIMLFYMQPAFYCGIDDSYLFPKASERMYVAFGGAYFELMLCSAALPLWLLTPAEWFVHELALLVVLLSGLSLVLFNLNPLVKLDGYYVLMDFLNVPNLREESFAFMGNAVRKHILHLDVDESPISRRRRRIYLVYGALSVSYTALIMVLLYQWLSRIAVGWLGPAGYLALAAVALFYMRRQIRNAARFLKHLWLDKRDLLLSRRGGAAAGLTLLAIAFVLFVPRTATRVDAPFVVEPGERAVVRARAEGFIREVGAVEGTPVRAGQLLARMENLDLEIPRRVAESDLERARDLARIARRDGDPASERERNAEAAEAAARLTLLRGREADLALQTPIDGVVATPRVEERVGARLAEGEAFCAIDRLDVVRLAVDAAEIDVEEIGEGTPVRAAIASLPGRTISARVRSLAPIATAPAEGTEKHLDLVRRAQRVRILVEVENPDGRIRPGMTGRLQFLTTPRSFSGKAWWQLHRWLSSIVW